MSRACSTTTSHSEPDDNDKENHVGDKRKRKTALLYPPKKRINTAPDPVQHWGKHFGRTVSSVVNMRGLVGEGVRREVRLRQKVIMFDDLPLEEQREHKVFTVVLERFPDLIQILAASEHDAYDICDRIQAGIKSARNDDTKSIKSAIIEWITPPDEVLSPKLSSRSKLERGFNHPVTGRMICPVAWDWDDPKVRSGLKSGMTLTPGEHWPSFVYAGLQYDPEDPWRGLFRGEMMVKGCKHIFTSPSSVDRKGGKATRSGNARLHGMTSITPAAIAYVATHIRFGLSSEATFTRGDYVTETERFYNTIMDLFEDPKEAAEVEELLAWWNRQVFPGSISIRIEIPEDTPLAKIREKRAALERAREAEAADALLSINDSGENDDNAQDSTRSSGGDAGQGGGDFDRGGGNARQGGAGGTGAHYT